MITIGRNPIFVYTMKTYVDGVSSVDLDSVYDQHFNSNVDVTLTAVQPSGRFGALETIKN